MCDGAEKMEKRSVSSFFADSDLEDGTVRICRGLSCELNGADSIGDSFPHDIPTRDVYCLGYCNHSPVILDAFDNIHCGEAARQFGTGAQNQVVSPGAGASIACIAREAVVTARVGATCTGNLCDATRAGVYNAIEKALNNSPDSVLETVIAAGEQGRGGAGYPTGKKWQACARQHGRKKYVIANGDEGDPGSFVDRVLLESDPHSVIEGMLLCAFAIGARYGIVYIRSEYPEALRRMQRAVGQAKRAGILGTNILDRGVDFDIEVVSGRGSYVCGEETALLNAIEGKRGEVRIRPPYPAEHGVYGYPTVVNNIETLVNIPWIVVHGAAAYRKMGTATSPGTKVFSINAGFANPGLIEAEFGITFRDLVDAAGGSSSNEDELAAIAIGGPMGSVLLPDEWGVVIDYPNLRSRNIRLGHGGLVAIPAGTRFDFLLRHWLDFMVSESCGKCVPCSFGSARALRIAQRIETTGGTKEDFTDLRFLLSYIRDGSLCGFGQEVPQPIMTLLTLCEHAAVSAKATP